MRIQAAGYGESAVSTRSQDVAWGLRIGASMATVYSVTALAIIVGSGLVASIRVVDVLLIVCAYYAAALAGGTVLGLLRRYNRSLLGIVLMSPAIGLPVWLAMGSVAFGLPLSWDETQWMTYLIEVVLVSPVAGAVYWFRVLRHG